MYLTGAGVDQDDDQAVYWLKQSAEQELGGAGAQQALAYLFEEGLGDLPRDKYEAVRLYLLVSDKIEQSVLDALQMMQLY